jgi:hypothetical protein
MRRAVERSQGLVESRRSDQVSETNGPDGVQRHLPLRDAGGSPGYNASANAAFVRRVSRQRRSAMPLEPTDRILELYRASLECLTHIQVDPRQWRRVVWSDKLPRGVAWR